MYKDEDGYYVVKEEWRKPTNPFERLKLAKDPMKETIHLAGLEDAATACADDFKAWDEKLNDPDEVDQRYKWAGLFHRRKGHYGRYMLRLKIPNGVVTSEQVRHLAGVISSCGEDGCADITTRQNFQLRGIELKDAPEIIKGMADQGLCSLQSGLDNVRNATGNPLAGFDPRKLSTLDPSLLRFKTMSLAGAEGIRISLTFPANGMSASSEDLISTNTRISMTWRSFQLSVMVFLASTCSLAASLAQLVLQRPFP